MGRYQRQKGQRGEREACKLLADLYPGCKRHLEFQKQEADMGIDIDNTGFVDIQVKIGKQVPKKIYDFINQIKSRDGQYKVVMMKRDNERWLALMELEDLKELLNILKVEGVKI